MSDSRYVSDSRCGRRGSRPGADAGAGSAAGRLDAALVDVVRDTGASMGLVYLSAPGERMLRMALFSGAPRQIAAPWARIPVDAPIPVADAVRDRKLVWLGSQEETARRYPRLGIVLPYDFMLAAAPVATAAKVWGGLVLLWPVRHPAQLSGTERTALDRFCRRAGLLMQQAEDSGHPFVPADEPRSVPPLPRTEADPELAASAHDFAERLPMGCCALDLEGRITFLNAAGAELVGRDAASLRGARPWEALSWLWDPAFEDRYRAAVVSRRPTSFTALRPPDTWLFFQLYPDADGISVHITPTGGPPLADVPTDAAVGPGAQPAQPAEHVGATALYHLTHLAASLAEAAGVHEVADLVADQIVPAFGPQGLVLMTVNDGRLRIVGHRGYSEEFINRFDGTPLTSGLTTVQVLATGAPVFFPSFEDFQRAYPSAPRYGDRDAWAFLPLIASGRTIGSLVLSYARSRPFPPAERALLTSLAGLIAQALDRARLYDAKHTLAHTLQTGLLPSALPSIDGLDVAARYLPAGHGMDIGGDFYDLIRCDAGTTAAAIGDVQGHNVNAATLMGQVRTAVHAHATAGASPGDVLARTNRLLADLDPGLFTSCLIAELDLPRHRVRLSTAGHPPPLLRHPDRHTEVLGIPPGLLLGIVPDAEYRTAEFPLPPDAVLALYTDGLVESPGVDIDAATAELAGHLQHAAQQDLDGLADALLQHARAAAPRADDIALLLIRPTL
ncbi:SpoIIE family protein phosphatase [Streptomyces sp. HNM0663]|uniref:SpoIIE family protein phosphatase n=1 Tax=Streptomyces chengmaiensis TaxID=3040919 RepID=A0ABT6HQ88_9ACTN|nr:SpoIIE family protein phosphatase [Streptomyces chengmaiensis]MDH2390505.1 SpoIIE family protein phosphatase [Streptomyces chengmaiensis]